MGLSVSMTHWSKLTPGEKALAKTLGIMPKLPSNTPRQTFISKAPEPYTLHAIIHCGLCKSTTEAFFLMLVAEKPEPHLYSVRINKELANQPIKTKDIYVNSCSACFQELKKWKKEDLIKKLIKVFPLASGTRT